jgi:tetratricopeptide (TPR) repeat protein
MTPAGRFLTTLATLAALAGLGWWGWTAIRPRPVLDRGRFEALTASRRFESAEVMLSDYLRRVPGDPEASYLLAQLLLERPVSTDDDLERDARRALDLLRRADTRDPARLALARMYEGKALKRLDHWGECEAAMLDALRIDPTVPEAGWILLELYYVEGRPRDAADLALRMFRIEPDPHDRAQYLLELVRQDAQPPDAASIVDQLEPVYRAEPEALSAAVALGLAHIRNSHADQGLELLKSLHLRHRNDPRAWDGLMAGHDLAGQPEAVSALLAVLPENLAEDERFARHRGRVAQWKNDWPLAVKEFRKAIVFEPYDPSLLFRLSRGLRLTGQTEEADELAAQHEAYVAAMKDVLPLYNEANAVPTLGVEPHPDLCHRLADLRRRMMRPAEAAAWEETAEGLPASPPASVDRPVGGG